ncbi:MAG: type VI secretion system baseplate subunit TssE [Acidobacteriia bacterium]|nr:type VI secretion system baseplate subunit TssE [Terriglobia bacterium]
MVREPRQPKPTTGARTPLFERLIDEQPHELAEIKPRRVHSRLELRESVRSEVANLLNTRCPVRVDRNGSVIDYGIPDFSWMNAASGDDRQRLAEIVTRKIAAFEPRLKQIRVSLERDSADPRAITGTIEGVLAVESIREPLSFILAIHHKGEQILLTDSLPRSHASPAELEANRG